MVEMTLAAPALGGRLALWAFAQKAVLGRGALKHIDSALGLRTLYWWGWSDFKL
jgi:hypothetical protein